MPDVHAGIVGTIGYSDCQQSDHAECGQIDISWDDDNAGKGRIKDFPKLDTVIREKVQRDLL